MKYGDRIAIAAINALDGEWVSWDEIRRQDVCCRSTEGVGFAIKPVL
jgi:hypothetical protein